MKKTYSTKQAEIKRSWRLIDLKNKVLGRVATEIAGFLMGKDKPYFAFHLDCGDYVVAINSDEVKVTGKKAKQKKYYRHSGYPGGFREIPFCKQMDKDSTKVIRHAVSGMLPKNKLRAGRLVRLKIFAGEDHPYADELKGQSEK